MNDELGRDVILHSAFLILHSEFPSPGRDIGFYGGAVAEETDDGADLFEKDVIGAQVFAVVEVPFVAVFQDSLSDLFACGLGDIAIIVHVGPPLLDEVGEEGEIGRAHV